MMPEPFDLTDWLLTVVIATLAALQAIGHAL